MNKKWQKSLVLLAAAVLLFVFAGCESILERDFVIYEVHSEPEGTEDSGEVAQVSGYGALRTELLDALDDGITEKTVRLHDYDGDVETDVQRVLHEIMNENPLGAYLVNTIAYQQSKILTYYEIRFDIAYRRSPAQRAAVQDVFDREDFEEALLEGMLHFSEQLAVDIRYYSPTFYDPAPVYEKLYYETPMAAYGTSGITYTLYPDTGSRRIMEINFTYAEPGSSLRVKAKHAEAAARAMAAQLDPSDTALVRAAALHDALCLSAVYDTETAEAVSRGDGKGAKTDPFTAYGALVNGKAVCEGYALAYKQLLDEAGIASKIVVGRLDGEAHAWNLVRLDDGWYHIDVTNDDTDEFLPGRIFFAMTDEMMAKTHTWESMAYPPSGLKRPEEIPPPSSSTVMGEPGVSIEAGVTAP